MVAAVLGTFACVPIDSPGAADPYGQPLNPGPALGHYWLSDMHQRCWQPSGTQMRVALSVGLLGALLLVVVLPGVIIWVVQRNRDVLDRPDFLAKFGSLVSDYKPRAAWWEAVNLLMMALLVAANAFGRGLGAYLNLLVFVGVQLVCVLVHTMGRPQLVRRLHWVQTAAYCAVLMVRAGRIAFQIRMQLTDKPDQHQLIGQANGHTPCHGLCAARA